MIYLLSNLLIGDTKPTETVTPETSTSQSEQIIEEVTEPEEPLQWRFYWIDLWILVVGGGFCSVMIIREKRKAREQLK